MSEPTLIRTEAAVRYRIRALAASWRSSALWNYSEAEICPDENEQIALRRQAQAFEICANHIEQTVRDWPTSKADTKETKP